MTARDLNIDAYRIMAEILVTVRRIVHRGLEKVFGETWYLDGCPPGLFERLVKRKEDEIGVDRFENEYQELISFASFDDLAEIIDFNNDMAKLLAAIAPKGASIVDRLREIEALRLKLEATVPFDDGDVENLLEYHRDFREAVARRIKKSGAATTASTPAAAEEKPSVAEEAPGRDFVTQISEVDEVRVEDAAAAPDDGAAAVPVEPPASEGPMDSAEEVQAAERAMVSQDDVEVLRILRREVMSVAEAVFQRDVDWTHPVWEMLATSGWYELKKFDMELVPLELFFALAEEARNRQRSGADLDELKDYLEETQFSKLLLSLREMFMRHQL